MGYILVPRIGRGQRATILSCSSQRAASLPSIHTTTPLGSISTIRSTWGLDGTSKVSFVTCRIITKSPKAKETFGLSQPPRRTRRYLSLSRCCAIAKFLMARGITHLKAPLTQECSRPLLRGVEIQLLRLRFLRPTLNDMGSRPNIGK